MAWRGQPQAIGLDNGPECLADRVVIGAPTKLRYIQHIQPGQPNQHAFVERFNRMFRYEMLDAYVFESLGPVCEISVAWIQEYNEERLLDMLDGRPPVRVSGHQTGRSPLKIFP